MTERKNDPAQRALELPPLPKDERLSFGHSTPTLEAYALAAILADRQRLGVSDEAVADLSPCPIDRWADYAKRGGLLDENGVAPERMKAQTAFYAYSAGWYESNRAFAAALARQPTPASPLVAGAEQASKVAPEAPNLAGDFVEHSHPEFGRGYFCTPDVFARIEALAASEAEAVKVEAAAWTDGESAPGMWEESDLSGGQTDSDRAGVAPAAPAEPSESVTPAQRQALLRGLHTGKIVAPDRAGVASLVASDVQPTHEEIHAHFKLYHCGPNPYYACVHCGGVEPGLEEYLVKHMRKCGYGPQASAGEAQS